MSVKILATSDLHLGRRSADLPQHDDASSVKYSWRRIIQYVIDEQVDLLVLTGDIVDESNAYYEAKGPLREGFQKLAEASIPVMMVSGNHDFEVLAQLIDHNRWEGVHLLGRDGQWEYKKLTLNGHDLGFAGWSFPRKHVMTDPMLSFDSIADELDHNRINIGLLHGDVDAAGSQYAPLQLSSLKQSACNMWILGHIHKPQVFNDSPLIAYPGSPHALSAGETGKHGPMLITIENKHDIQRMQLPLSPVRYESITVTVSEEHDENMLKYRLMRAIEEKMEELSAGLQHTHTVIVTLYLEGEHAGPFEVKDWAATLAESYEEIFNSTTTVRVRKVHHNVYPAVGNLQDLATQSSPAGRLAEVILHIENQERNDLIEHMLEEWMQRSADLKRAETYKPLRDAGVIQQPSREEGLRHILQQSKMLLNHMVRTKE